MPATKTIAEVHCTHDQLVALEDLKPNPDNPNVHPPAQITRLAQIIVKQGWRAPITVSNLSGMIVRGHCRLLAAQLAKQTHAPVDFQDYATPELEKADLVADNQIAELANLDTGKLADLFADVDMSTFDVSMTGFDEADFGEIINGGGQTEKTGSGSLAERFGVPPFSVLDARQGYWQDRKRSWLAIGLQSELGRGGDLTWGDSPEVTEKGLNYYRNKESQGGLLADNGSGVYGGGSPWAGNRAAAKVSPGGSPRPSATLGKDGKTVRGDGKGKELATSYSSQDRLNALQKTGDSKAVAFGPEGNISDRTGTSIFDPVLCELAYRWFCPPGGMVLDPFAGGSVRGIVASRLGRRYLGVDLAEAQIAANKQQWEEIGGEHEPGWVHGDSAKIASLCKGVEADFFFTCPPYFNLEIYSDDKADISNMSYVNFLAAYRKILKASLAMLKDDRFAVIVVGDIRTKAGPYHNFVSDTIAAFLSAGLELYNEAILVTAVGSLPLRSARAFEGSRKLGKTHQNVLVFIKGDAKAATEAIGEVDFRVSDAGPD